MAKFALLWASVTQALLTELPSSFNSTSSVWAFYSYENPAAQVLPGAFNRSVFDAPCDSETSDPALTEANQQLNKTDFVAYDERFFDFIGAKAKIEHVQHLAYQSHEAPCYNPESQELFFVEWGPPGGDDGTHTWQYMLDTKNNTLRKITTDPPTVNAHGCVYHEGELYVVTDGGQNETGSLNKIDPETLERTVLLNNYYEEPFMGFNDLEIDPDGNFWLTDSKAGSGRDIVPFTPPTNPTVYFVNGTTMRPQVVHITTGNANGVAFSPFGGGRGTLYIPDTGASVQKPDKKDPYGNRALYAFDVAPAGGVLSNQRFLNNPISYFYDGIRVSRNGWIWAGSGDGVDVVDPQTGLALGSIRVGGGDNLAVSLAFGEHELWIVGKGGVWHVSEIKERLDREW